MAKWTKEPPQGTGWFWSRWRTKTATEGKWNYATHRWDDGRDDEGDGPSEYTEGTEWWPIPLTPPAEEDENADE